MDNAGTETLIAHFRSRCVELGLALTPQRLAVYRALAASPAHPGAEEIFRAVKPEVPSLSLGTVYRTLELFERHGLAARIHAGGDTARFDANLGDHHHLVCTRCRAVADYEDTGLSRLPLREEAPLGFRLVARRVQLLGLCPACQEASGGLDGPGDDAENDS
jgi:Fur family peroxide stress response transcriptional regulator